MWQYFLSFMEAPRDHVLELKMILSDGAEVVFRSLSNEEFEEKCERADHEGDIYRYF